MKADNKKIWIRIMILLSGHKVEHIGAPGKKDSFRGRRGAMQRWSLAACGEASIAESALRMSQQVRAALGEPQRGIGPWS